MKRFFKKLVAALICLTILAAACWSVAGLVAMGADFPPYLFLAVLILAAAPVFIEMVRYLIEG